ncbi:MAG: sugar transferase [Gammaproteobacteria bacterium]|nr:sugar transferase [Gammaproteobacteria bacterium]MDE1983152.1 sugar transferase [Gammaproteobacteria bacterium]
MNQMELQSLYVTGAGRFAGGRALRWGSFPVLLWSLLGLVLVIGGSLLFALLLAVRPGVAQQLFVQHLPLILAVVAAYAVATIVIEKISRFPGWSSVAVVLPAVTGVFLVLVCTLWIGRFYYSRSFLLAAYCLSLLWLMVGMHLRRRYLIPRLALVLEGEATELAKIRGVRWQVLVKPSLANTQVDGVVVDLHAKLSDPWLRFIADCALHNVPVYHARWVYESVTGRTSLEQMSDGFMSSLEPSGTYLLGKRAIDVLAVLAISPLVVLLLAIITLAIKTDAPGPVFFVQERVGRGGQIFRMLKFRSMHLQSESDGARFADHADPRVTRVGKVLRKWRLDELPQVGNVLLGHMSLVGPRPEQVDFVRYFEAQIPFYGFRQIIRPGITGWAQVTHGYAADVESTAEKLERDIYYIRHMSVWLDVAILIRTLRTLITGFGAR